MAGSHVGCIDADRVSSESDGIPTRAGGQTMEIHPNITGIDVSGFGAVWVFLARGQRTALIDTGPKQLLHPMPMEQSPQSDVLPVLQFLPAALDKMGMTMADIDLILNTHIHFDHNGGNAAIKTASEAKISIHAAEAHYFENPGLLFEHEQAPVVEMILGKDHLGDEKKKYLEEATGPGPYAAVDSTFVDGDTVDLGGGCELKVVHLPGHSEGSVGFYWEKEGILLAGDALQGVHGHGGGLPILDDPAAFERSLERAQQMPLRIVVNSHPFPGLTTPASVILQDSGINKYLEECRKFMWMLRESAEGAAADLYAKPFLETYDEVIDVLPDGIGLNKWNHMHQQFFSPATLLNCIRQSSSYKEETV